MASDSQSPSKQRLWLGATLALIVAGIALTGGFFWSQSQKAANATALQKLEERVARDNARLELTDAQKATRLERAKFLRGKWRVWALAHKDELKQMLNAKPDDERTFSAVWNSIPAIPVKSSEGISAQDLRSEDALLQGVAYGWNPVGKVEAQWPRSPTTEELNRASWSQKYQAAKLQDDFKQFRDIEISSSVNHGKTKLCLWASGRITEQTTIHNRKIILPGGVKTSARESEEIVPVYDFLKD